MANGGLRWVPDVFDAYCLAFVRGVTVGELVRRLGADPAAVREGVTGQAAFTSAMNEGAVSLLGTAQGWAFSLEHWSEQAAQADVLARLSGGTEAVVMVNGGVGTTRFLHAVDGLVVADFEPGVSAADMNVSADERLVPLLGDTDFFDGDECSVLGEADEESWMLRLAERAFGLSLPRQELEHGALDAVLLP
ncbi:DUF6461 domain-containing protein [Streptomyces sp. NPDC005435]|uniref:DUF6461 domain-containing protein n=1 Tax=Streptomyces sp. NPDC005435 TaxID=3154464 RepID=UPI00345377EE